MKQSRKISGGKYHSRRKKRLHETKTQTAPVALKETKKKKLRTMGGNYKTILLNSNIANVEINPGKVKKTEIKNVLETPQNVFLARQNRLTKGAIIETLLGKARVTNRPSQEGHINAVLLKE